MEQFRILVINPGSTSTKIACFENDTKIFEKSLAHSPTFLAQFQRVWDQYDARKELILKEMIRAKIPLHTLSAVVGRGGFLRPVKGGTYIIDQKMINDLRAQRNEEHASNLGAPLAYGIAWDLGIPAYIVDPVCVDELEPIARISGIPEIERKSIFHALNMRAVSRKVADEMGKKLEAVNFILAHLGGGVTVCALQQGKAVDATHGLEEGPMTPERSGSLPMFQLISLCYSGQYTFFEMLEKLVGKAGLVAYLGTNNAAEVERMIDAGDEKACLVYEAMAYQVAKEIAAMAAVLKGKVDAVILTGGLAKSKYLIPWITERVEFLAPVRIVPGEMEMQALALGGLRVLRKEEIPKVYGEPKKTIGVVYWAPIPEYSLAFESLEKILRRSGYRFREANENLEIIYRSAEKDEPHMERIIDYFLHLKVDLIYAVGSPAAFMVKRKLKGKDVPVICGPLYDPVLMGIVDNYEAPGENITGVAYRLPMKEQLERGLMQLLPQVKKVGILRNPGKLHSEIQCDEAEQVLKSRGIHYLICNVQSPEDLPKALQYFKEEAVEALICPADSNLTFASDKIIRKLGVTFPMQCSLQSIVAKGGLLGYCADWHKLCEEGALMALKILGGLPVSKISVHRPKDFRLVYNAQTAKKLGLLEKVLTLHSPEEISPLEPVS